LKLKRCCVNRFRRVKHGRRGEQNRSTSCTPPGQRRRSRRFPSRRRRHGDHAGQIEQVVAGHPNALAARAAYLFELRAGRLFRHLCPARLVKTVKSTKSRPVPRAIPSTNLRRPFEWERRMQSPGTQRRIPRGVRSPPHLGNDEDEKRRRCGAPLARGMGPQERPDQQPPKAPVSHEAGDHRAETEKPRVHERVPEIDTCT